MGTGALRGCAPEGASVPLPVGLSPGDPGLCDGTRHPAATVALVADGLRGLYAVRKRLQQGGMPLKDRWSTGEHPWGSRENLGPRQLSFEQEPGAVMMKR